MKLRHVGIVVSDLKKALKFYRDLFGFKEVSRRKEKGDIIEELLNCTSIEVQWIKLKADNDTLLELLKFNIPDEINPKYGLQHVALTVKNIDKIYKELHKKIEFVSIPIKKDNVKLAFCKDYDNNLVELVEEL